MPKVKFNQLIDTLSGRVGNFIFYEADGQRLSRTMPEITAKRTLKQVTNSARFLAAQQYAATALQDPTLRASYKAACRGHQNPRNLAIRDAMRAPVVESIIVDAYTGKPGQILRVKATDDFRVAQVQVTVRGPGGELIEQGLAEPNADGNEWCYTSTVEVPGGQSVLVQALARDIPGNSAEGERWQHIPPPAASL